MSGRHSRDERDIAGSDLPARGEGVTFDNAKGKPDKAVGTAKPAKPSGYKGGHRR